MWCKTYVLHHPIRDYHINILLRIQYILPHLITYIYIYIFFFFERMIET